MKRTDDVEPIPTEHSDSGRFVRVADSYRAAGDFERALAVLREGLETHASFVPAYVLLGRILIEQRRFSEALVTLERVLEIDPHNDDARVSIELIMERLKHQSDPPRPQVQTVAEERRKSLFPDDTFALIPQDIDELYMTQDVERFTPRQAETPSAVPPGETMVALADLLVGLIEYRDPHFRGGTSLTRLLAAAISRELGLTQDEVSAIELGIVLRDIGHVAMKDVLAQPESDLALADRDRIARHVETTLNLLASLNLPAVTRDVIRHHHERWDGSGYPDALVGKATPIGARIAGVADSFAAMISARPHRLPRRPPAAFDEISTLAGKQYDPTVVHALERVLEGADWRGVRFGLRHHILIIDSDEARGVALAVKLGSNGYLAEAVDLAMARDRFEHSRLSGIIISGDIGDSEIRQLVSELRDSVRLAMLPVVIADASGPSRVSLLEAGADVCLPVGTSFDELRATLGAFLRREDRAALNTRKRGAPPPWSGLQGEVEDFPLKWLLQMLNYDGRTAAIFVEDEHGDEGVIYLQSGHPRHAHTKTLTGDDALRFIMTWDKGTFRVGPEVKTDKQTISVSLMKLLLDQEQRAFFGAVQV